MTTKNTAFKALHKPGDPFILANAWDAGSAKMLASLGAQAIGTSSAAHAFTLGRPDMGQVSRDEALAHAQDLVAATPLPVSGDFENGFANDPDGVADTVRLSSEVGVSGISIEDSDFANGTAYDFDLTIERIKAAVAATNALGNDFVLVARADGVMNGYYDMDEAMRRIKAFDAAGATCLYVPIPPDFDAIKTLCASTQTPVNALAAGPFIAHSRADYAAAGVARISLGSALARVTHKAILQAASPMFESGDFSNLRGIGGGKIDQMLEDGSA